VNDEPDIEQALCQAVGTDVQILAQSPGWELIWARYASRICSGFGSRPNGVRCEDALFAQPFGPNHVTVVQVTEIPEKSSGLAFRFLVLPRRLYAERIADPFRVSEQFTPNWSARGELTRLTWPLELPPPRRSVGQLQKVLQSGGSTTLLGAVQALIDGGRVAFERPTPTPQLVRDLWQLLPYNSQAELWPTTFALSNELGFDILVTPSKEGWPLDRYITEEQAVDYPEGRYELSLQVAIESGNQHDLDHLLARRTSRQTMRLALFMLVGAVLITVIVGLLNHFM
jgi:hypothetical protein